MDASPTSSRYADLRSAALPSQRVASELHKYNTKLARASQKPLRTGFNSAAAATPMPHWSTPISNQSPLDARNPTTAENLSKREVWRTSQISAGGSKLRKHHSDRSERAIWDRDVSGENALRLRYAVGDRAEAGSGSNKLDASISSIRSFEGDSESPITFTPSYASVLSPSGDVGAEVTYLRGKETADSLVDGALRKWRTERKKGAEKLGWTVVLDGADGEGAIFDGEGEDEWEVLSN